MYTPDHFVCSQAQDVGETGPNPTHHATESGVTGPNSSSKRQIQLQSKDACCIPEQQAVEVAP
jgi:hypothetical protein